MTRAQTNSQQSTDSVYRWQFSILYYSISCAYDRRIHCSSNLVSWLTSSDVSRLLFRDLGWREEAYCTVDPSLWRDMQNKLQSFREEQAWQISPTDEVKVVTVIYAHMHRKTHCEMSVFSTCKHPVYLLYVDIRHESCQVSLKSLFEGFSRHENNRNGYFACCGATIVQRHPRRMASMERWQRTCQQSLAVKMFQDYYKVSRCFKMLQASQVGVTDYFHHTDSIIFSFHSSISSHFSLIMEIPPMPSPTPEIWPQDRIKDINHHHLPLWHTPQEVGRLWHKCGRQAAELDLLRSEVQRSSQLLERLRASDVGFLWEWAISRGHPLGPILGGANNANAW